MHLCRKFSHWLIWSRPKACEPLMYMSLGFAQPPGCWSSWTPALVSRPIFYRIISYSLFFVSVPLGNNCFLEFEPLWRLWSFRWQPLFPPEMLFVYLFNQSRWNCGVSVDMYNEDFIKIVLIRWMSIFKESLNLQCKSSTMLQYSFIISEVNTEMLVLVHFSVLKQPR